MKFIDIKGQKFNKLIAVRLYKIDKQEKRSVHYWVFLCDCGKRKVINKGNVTSGNVLSCGCHRKICRFKHGYARQGKMTPTFNSWNAMIQRCHGHNGAYIKNGIVVCDSWKESFTSFLNDMGERPKGKSLDRINPYLGYFKENCRWATALEQRHNTRKDYDERNK